VALFNSYRPLTPTLSNHGSESIWLLSSPEARSFTSHVDHTKRPWRNCASGDAAHTAKPPGIFSEIYQLLVLSTKATVQHTICPRQSVLGISSLLRCFCKHNRWMEWYDSHVGLWCITSNLLHDGGERVLGQLVSRHLRRAIPTMDILGWHRYNELERQVSQVILSKLWWINLLFLMSGLLIESLNKV
jgi:hypothetical protein